MYLYFYCSCKDFSNFRIRDAFANITMYFKLQFCTILWIADNHLLDSIEIWKWKKFRNKIQHLLTHYCLVLLFSTPWKHQKTMACLIFSGDKKLARGSNSTRKQTVDIDILLTSVNVDRKIMQTIRMMSWPTTKIRKQNQFRQFRWISTKVIPRKKTRP